MWHWLYITYITPAQTIIQEKEQVETCCHKGSCLGCCVRILRALHDVHPLHEHAQQLGLTRVRSRSDRLLGAVRNGS